jgi:hypothetical protein
MKGSDLLVAALENEGVEQIFGVATQFIGCGRLGPGRESSWST